MIEVNSQIDAQQPFIPQVVAMADQCGLSPAEWQTSPVLVNPLSLHWVAVTLLVEIHGPVRVLHRQFTPVIGRGFLPPGFEVAGILNLHGVRDRSRAGRIFDFRLPVY